MATTQLPTSKRKRSADQLRFSFNTDQNTPVTPAEADMPARPWPAKFSLFTWGIKAFADTLCRIETPALCWAFPDWDAPPWSRYCTQLDQEVA